VGVIVLSTAAHLAMNAQSLRDDARILRDDDDATALSPKAGRLRPDSHFGEVEKGR
jgi:hypothetical protein